MIRYRFGASDLLRTRFAIAPLIELAAAVYALRDPRRSPVHRPWAVQARPRVEGLDVSLLDALSPVGTGTWTVFEAPPPLVPHPAIEDELARVLATPPEQVTREVVRVFGTDPPAGARPFIDDPATALVELVAQMRAFWDAALAPWWPRVAALLEAEIAARAKRLVAVGSAAAFEDLDDTITYRREEIVVDPTEANAADVELAGRGLLIIPSAFTWPKVWPRYDPPWDPALVYPVAGVAELWEPEADGDALADLLGARRAAILRSLEGPASTQALAARLGIGASSVSTHLTILRRAGLVTRRREGREVVYARTASGDALAI